MSATLVLAAAALTSTVSRAFTSRPDWSRSSRRRHIHTTPTTATTTNTPSRLWGWSQQASVFYDDDDDVSNKAQPRVLLEDCSSTVVTTKEGITLDLSSPREWLEHDGSPDGAYTVIRCDGSMTGSSSSNRSSSSSRPVSETAAAISIADMDWHIWGLDFHLHRLVQSLEGCCAQSQGLEADFHFVPTTSLGTDTASSETRRVLDALLAQAARELSPVLSSRVALGGEHNKVICVAMVTILWFLDHNSHGTNTVRVKGHVCTSGIPVSTDPTKYDPDPIQVVLALRPSTDRSVSQLPSRKDSYPEAKLSAWCRRRRPLEVQFKPAGVGEVLLVDEFEYDDGVHDNTPTNNEPPEAPVVHLLEGLTSNLFVVYPDNVLRTAATGVLHGYARQLVLAQAPLSGLTLDFTPIRLDESHLWLDCFVTSSVKLMAPVGKILVPVVAGEDVDGNNELKEVWSRGNVANSRSVWRDLYNEIMLDHDTH
jgi:hypothetical protein